MTKYPVFKIFVTAVVCVGGGWALYCISPAGAAERAQTRQQNEVRKIMYRKQQEETKKSEQ